MNKKEINREELLLDTYLLTEYPVIHVFEDFVKREPRTKYEWNALYKIIERAKVKISDENLDVMTRGLRKAVIIPSRIKQLISAAENDEEKELVHRCANDAAQKKEMWEALEYVM